ncbi:MAG: glycosyl hydrolase [Candidatus Omnitrophota bacterium]
MIQKIKLTKIILILILILLFFFYSVYMEQLGKNNYCLTGAFLADRPTRNEIQEFRNNYGKKPYLVMVFIDWGNFIEEDVYQDIFAAGSVPFITWEPWQAETKAGIEFDQILSGEYDQYIIKFIERITKFKKLVFLRFAHEASGNWYPWAGKKVGAAKLIAVQRYLKDLVDKQGPNQVKWVFSVNWQDIPADKDNFFMNYYPGKDYVDYFGIDGYNWGDTQEWSQWMEFGEIFKEPYQIITSQTNKPIIISEFGSAQSGGNKAKWIKNAFKTIKKMKRIKGFVLFNLDKEAAWRFRPQSAAGKQLKKELKEPYFWEKGRDE